MQAQIPRISRSELTSRHHDDNIVILVELLRRLPGDLRQKGSDELEKPRSTRLDLNIEAR